MPRTSRTSAGYRSCSGREAGLRLEATLGGVGDEAALEQVDRREGGGAGDRVAAVRRAVGARPPRLEQVRAGDHGAERHARRDALGSQEDVRLHAPVFDGPHLAGPARARLDLVGDEQDAVLVADVAQALEEAVLGDEVAALALDRLDDDRGDLVGGRELVEQDVVEPLEVLDPAVWSVEDARQERAEAGVVLRLRRRQGDGAVGAAVEGAEEGDDVRAVRGVAGELDRGFDRLGAGVAEVRPSATGDRRELGQATADLGVDREVEVAGAEVDELGGLLLDGGDHLRMRVPGGGDRDAGGEVEEQVAVDVLDGQAIAPDRHDRVGARQARRRPGLIERDVGASLRAG